jgi:hypothetical protein
VINFVGAVLGFDLRRPTVKFRGIGRIGRLTHAIRPSNVMNILAFPTPSVVAR